MDIELFLKDFENLFDKAETGFVTSDTMFRELDDWDSLTTMALISLASTKYGRMLSATELKSCATVGDIFDILSKS